MPIETVRLPLPISRDFMDKMVLGSQRMGGSDLRYMAEWILARNNADKIMFEIRDAWRQSVLPLRDWADDILDVDVVAQYDSWKGEALIGDFCLSVNIGRLAKPVLQQAPIDETTAELLSTDHLRGGLTAIRRYISEQDENPLDLADPNRGIFPVTSDHYSMAVARVGWDAYLLGVNGQLGWFESEQYLACLRCNVGLDDFVEQFFRDPKSLADPFRLGWAEDPNPFSAISRAIDELHDGVRESLESLTHRGGIALAIRCYERMLEYEKSVIKTEYFSEYRSVHQRVLVAAREVAFGGSLLDHNEAKAMYSSYSQFLQIALVDIFPLESSMTHLKGRMPRCGARAQVPARLLMSCTEQLGSSIPFSGVYAASSIVKSLSGHIEGFMSQRAADDLFSAMNDDLDILRTMDLGEPETLGAPVPESFLQSTGTWHAID